MGLLAFTHEDMARRIARLDDPKPDKADSAEPTALEQEAHERIAAE